MSIIKFENEYEVRASQKILYPYLNTPGGLSQWFADDVKIDEDKIYHFYWNDEPQRARLTAKRRDQFVRFEYLENGAGVATVNGEGEKEPAYLEFLIEKNELTQSVYLKVIDFVDVDDKEEVEELWEGMISSLREIVGG